MAKDKKKSLDDDVTEIFNAMEESAEPGAAELLATNAAATSDAYHAKYKSGKPIQDSEYEDANLEHSEFYVKKVLGMDENGKKKKDKGPHQEFYAGMVRSWMTREQQARFEEAMKMGNEDEAAAIIRQAYANNNLQAKVTTTMSRAQHIAQENPGEGIKFYKNFAKRLAGPDVKDEDLNYLSLIGTEGLAEGFKDLQRLKGVSSKYKKTDYSIYAQRKAA